MSEKNNSAQEGRPAAPEDESCDTDSMIWNAKSLQRVVEKLERNGSESPQSDLLHIQGRALAVPILLSLATEIALKALLCLERKKGPPRIHDLLKLFEQLEPDTQELLRTEMPGGPKLSDPRQSRGLISMCPSKGQVKSRLKAAYAPTACSAAPTVAPPAPGAECILERLLPPAPPSRRSSPVPRNSHP